MKRKDIEFDGWLAGVWTGEFDQLEVLTLDGLKKIADLEVGSTAKILMSVDNELEEWVQGMIVEIEDREERINAVRKDT